jgi:hypothetical protein
MVVGLAVAVASAQSTQPMNFRTPFAFAVGDQLLPAGAYTVHVVSVTGTLLVSRADGTGGSNFVSSIPLQKRDYENRYRLLFHRYGIQYYLSEIWAPGYRTGRAIIPQPSEQKLAKTAEPQHVTLYVESPGS